MKYIRTKDGIWQYCQENNSAERPNKEFKCNQIWLNIKETDIIKQADTIEELCNDFRFKDDNGKWESFRIYDAFVKAIKDLGHVPELAFASIKPKINDPKLIDVAIMNDEGELELL